MCDKKNIYYMKVVNIVFVKLKLLLTLIIQFLLILLVLKIHSYTVLGI